jgi:glycosyltransferase involved in cell wall biosynthesis
MAAQLALGLAPSYEVGAVGMYSFIDSVPEQAMRAAGIRLWSLNKREGFDVRMFPRLDRVLREFQPDIVHTHLYLLRYSLPPCIRRRIPILVHTVHNLAQREADAAGRAINWMALGKRVIPVAVSRSVADSLRQVYRIEDPVTIPNGIRAGEFHPDPAARAEWRRAMGFGERDFLFVSTGRLTPQKNPLLLLRAFRAMTSFEAHLILVGQGPLQSQVEEEVRAAGLGHRVHVLGFRDDIRECLAAADAFVLSSDWEGHPLGVMEAMACGLPVVATSVGGVPEVVESGPEGLLVPPGDAASLTGAMQFLLDNPQRRAAMGQASRRRAAAEFSEETMVQAYDRLYRSKLAAVFGAPRGANVAAAAEVR